MSVARIKEASHGHVTVIAENASLVSEVKSSLQSRGIDCHTTPAGSIIDHLKSAIGHQNDAVAFAPTKAPTVREAAQMAPLCHDAAMQDGPIVILAAYGPPTPKNAKQRSAAEALLISNGALLCRDPDAWLETVVLAAVYGIPAGPELAIVAPENSWIAASANSIGFDNLLCGARIPALRSSAANVGPANIVLVDSSVMPNAPSSDSEAMMIPIIGRGESLTAEHFTSPPLIGLRAAITAANAAGLLGKRRSAGLSTAPVSDIRHVDPEHQRFARQIKNLGDKAGDHETKVLLASYGIGITRQAVATTPSAATIIAKKAGYPVEIKPWGPDIPSEIDGCPVEVDLATAAKVRRAYAQVAARAKMPSGSPVIVRATPPTGREIKAEFVEMAPIGWMAIVEIQGVPAPIAAPCPLRREDARALAAHVEATRARDAAPDREGLADLLWRTSHLVVDQSDVIQSLHLHRIVVVSEKQAKQGHEKTIVVDANALLK